MNRSILIVICDFLLLSLLTFSSADLNKISDSGTAQPMKLEMAAATQTESRQDLAAVMKLALDDEKRIHDRLVGELTQTKDVAGRQQLMLSEREKLLSEERRNSERLLEELSQTKDTVGKQNNLLNEQKNLISEREKMLAERARQIQAAQQALQQKEQQARQLEQERSALEQRITQTQGNLENLRQQLQTTTTDALVSKEKVAATEAELRRQREQTAATEADVRKQQDQAAALRQQMAQLESSNQVVQAEKQQLATKLQVVETEKRSITDQLAKTADEVKIERAEKARMTEHAEKLAEGVKTLAAKSGDIAHDVKTLAVNSGDLAHEIREHRPLSPNVIFAEFATNRVHARFTAQRAGIFGMDLTKRKETDTVLVTDGTNFFALSHIDDTAISFAFPGTDWESLSGVLSRNTAFFSVGKVIFHQADPRVILIPVTPTQARDLGCKIYRVASDPFSFQEAVLVGAREGYYGECKFQIDLSTPEYLKMDHSVIRGIFGKFNPSHGDLVFNKGGELLGVMANSTYCVRLTRFTPTATLNFGQDVRAERTGELLSQLYSRVEQMPFKLQ